MISRRGKTEFSNFAGDYFVKYQQNPYDPGANDTGIVNTGTAENYLCKDLMKERFSRPDMATWTEEMQFYNVGSGTLHFRKSLAEFLTEQLQTHEPLKPENIFTGTGASTILEHLAFSLADEGEYFLCPTPAYFAFWYDMGARALVKLYDIPLKGRDIPKGAKPFQLTAEQVESCYKKAMEEGCKIRAILICNPANPIGSILNEKELEDILQFCARVKIHVIVDEAYAMSVFDESAKFCSALSLRNIPDPERLHVVWTFSKDLGLSGMRCGLVHTWNKDLHGLLYTNYTSMASMSLLIQNRLTTLISDRDWMNNVYFPTNLARMRRARKLMKEGLEDVGIKVYPSKAGFFIWADFSEVLHPLTFETEIAFFLKLIELQSGGVYMVPGKELHCAEPGWFRIVFTHTEELINVAIERIKKAVDMMRSEGVLSNLAEALAPPKMESAGGGKPKASLEDLLLDMRLSIKNTNWLEANTADKWANDNPDLAKAFKDAKDTYK
ncbi:1-aminocyclopropane-1-carboxylate synthase-like protein 1 [Lineus longissimus]|uniref:1-aminocyclopropane-1-carboxylate synthase-like protein 1 n=1 Tax=Lineus longissimus TaxID=88925 RepID=UPI002B4E8E2E